MYNTTKQTMKYMEMETETGSKKVGDDDHESEPDSSNSPIELLPPEMLQSIYEFLPFPDLLVCRGVNKKWKSVATHQVRKRCAPIDFSREDIPKNQRSRAIQSFNHLIRATDQQGGLEEFPVAKFILVLNKHYCWIEMGGSTVISQFMGSVSPFVKHIIFRISETYVKMPNNCPAIPQDQTFPNLTKITIQVEEQRDIPSVIFSFIRSVLEKCPNLKEIKPQLYNVRRSGATRRCIVETGIEQKVSLVTSLMFTAPKNESEFEYLNKLGFKLENFSLNLCQHNGNTGIFKAVLKNSSDTLTSLCLHFGNRNNCQYFRELPYLPHLEALEIFCFEGGLQRFQLPNLFYKTQLPALKSLNLEEVRCVVDCFMASHMAPSESLRELILPKEGTIKNAGEVIRQAARLFPNLKKLQVFHESAGPYMSDIYTELAGIEELCITSDGSVNVDEIITGLPGRLSRKIGKGIRRHQNPSYHLSKAVAMLERGTTKTLTCLENLKILMIYRGKYDNEYVVEGEDFTELSGVVLKQIKGLERIDFGVRKFGPILSPALKENLETQGIKLVHRRPPYVRSRSEFIVSLTDDSDSDNLYSSSEGETYSDLDTDSG